MSCSYEFISCIVIDLNVIILFHLNLNILEIFTSSAPKYSIIVVSYYIIAIDVCILSILKSIFAKNEILNSTTTFGGGIYSRTVKVYSFI